MVEILAEVGCTHGGSVDKAVESVHAFAEAGATAIKFQFLSPELIASPSAERYWHTNTATSQIEAFAKAVIPYEDWGPVIRACDDTGVTFITTPFDLDAVAACKAYGVRTLKVASGDINNFMLLEAVADVAEKVIVSTGGADLSEVRAAADVCGWHKTVVLACSLVYPTPLHEAELGRIHALLVRFPDLRVGYSDHTVSTNVAGFAVFAGATVLEKHVTLGGDPETVADHKMGLSPAQFAKYAGFAKKAADCLGSGLLGCNEQEKPAVAGARRGLYASVPIGEGHRFTVENVIALRPNPPEGHASAADWPQLVGQRSYHDYGVGDPIKSAS